LRNEPGREKEGQTDTEFYRLLLEIGTSKLYIYRERNMCVRVCVCVSTTQQGGSVSEKKNRKLVNKRTDRQKEKKRKENCCTLAERTVSPSAPNKVSIYVQVEEGQDDYKEGAATIQKKKEKKRWEL
jgi:hypothetical protein